MSSERRNVKSGMQLPLVVDSHERPVKDFLTPAEVDQLLLAAKQGRHGIRDYVLLLMMYRHGYRVSELCSTRLTDLSLDTARIWVRRVKGGLSTEHPMDGEEIRAIKRYLSYRNLNLPWLFTSERDAPLTRQAVNYIIGQAGKRAGLNVHPHILRHSCGYYLANRGYDQRLIQDYLGHRDPRHTAHYTRTAGVRFEGLWK